MSKLPWIVGGGALAAYWWTRAPHANRVVTRLPGRWVWPVASWNGRTPVVSDGFNSPRAGYPRHGGVDIMFQRLPTDAFKVATPNASRLHVMPDNVPVLAASDGVVWSAMRTPTGNAVVIDHGPRKVSTFYAHLDKLFVTETTKPGGKQLVKAGQMIGTVGFSPLDPQKLKHLLCAAAHKRCNAERLVMRRRRAKCAASPRECRPALRITLASRRPR